MPTLEKSLWNAAWNGNLAVIQQCIADGAQVNGHGFNGATPLEAAAYHGQADACQILLDAGADPNATPPAKPCCIRQSPNATIRGGHAS